MVMETSEGKQIYTMNCRNILGIFKVGAIAMSVDSVASRDVFAWNRWSGYIARSESLRLITISLYALLAFVVFPFLPPPIPQLGWKWSLVVVWESRRTDKWGSRLTYYEEDCAVRFIYPHSWCYYEIENAGELCETTTCCMPRKFEKVDCDESEKRREGKRGKGREGGIEVESFFFLHIMYHRRQLRAEQHYLRTVRNALFVRLGGMLRGSTEILFTITASTVGLHIPWAWRTQTRKHCRSVFQ